MCPYEFPVYCLKSKAGWKSRAQSVTWSCYVTVTEGLPLTSPTELFQEAPLYVFPPNHLLWWISSPLPIGIFISPFSLPATCISVTIAYEGQKTLKLTYWGGDTFAHVNGKSGVRAAAQTILSNCFLFSISRSTSVVLTPFSDIPPPAPWCQDIPPPAPWLPPTLALPYMLLGSSPRERPRLPQQSNQNCGSDSLVSQSETGCPLHIDDWWQGSA